jgi:anti-sigma B factor antagonist
VGYHIATVDAIPVVELSGDFWGGDETRKLSEAFANLLEGGNRKVVIDLSKTSYLNSTALGVLVRLHTTVSRQGGKLTLAGISKRIHNIFLITKLAFVFDTYDSVAEAVESLKKWKAPEAGGIQST